MTDFDLSELRDRIAAIDEKILRLARERIECAREVGLVKVEAGRPVRDYRRERVVLERTRTICDDLGLPFELGEGVLRVLIEEAVRVQEALRERIPSADPGRVLVVGGSGGMGGWLCRYFEAQGHGVTVVDPVGGSPDFPTAESVAVGWAAADIVALSVPLHAGVDLWEQVLELPPGPLVFDIFSLKSPASGCIREAVRRGHIAASVHPMFGPTARLLSGRSLVICDTGCPEAARRVRELFEATSLSLVEIPLDEHDRRMADVLGLSHAVNLVFARALAASPLDAAEMRETASTTFHQQARTTAEVAGENPALYFEIQALNPHTPEVLERLAAALASLRAEVAENRSGEFIAAMEEGRRRLAELQD